MKLYLLILGLYAISVPSGQGPVEVLFLDARVHGGGVPRHNLTLSTYIGDGASGAPLKTELRWAAPVELRIGGDAAVTLVEPNSFANLTSILSGGVRRVLRSDCSGPRALHACKVGKRSALTARLVLGGGRLSAVEIKPGTWNILPIVNEADVRGRSAVFRSARAGVPGESAERLVFNGVLYELDLPADGQGVELEVGDTRIPLRPRALEQCEQLPGSPDKCIILELGNLVDLTTIDATEAILGAINNTYETNFTIAKNTRVDEHFHLVYSLLGPPDVPSDQQWVPHFQRVNDDPPFVRCIPPLVYQPEAAP